MKLNIGAGIDVKDGYTSVDRLPSADVVMDIERDPWPWEHGSIEEIMAEHVVEHLDDFARFMNNCHHVLKAGGTLTITTPHPLYEWYWQDPTHKRGYTMNTFTIYCTGHPKTRHTGIIPWAHVDATQRVFRVNDIQACEIKAVLTK